MLNYFEHVLPLLEKDHWPDQAVSLLQAHPEVAKALLDGWVESRTGEVDMDSLVLLSHQAGDRTGEGFVELSFSETSWMACRYETGSTPHKARIPYVLQTLQVILRSLPKGALGERVDEI